MERKQRKSKKTGKKLPRNWDAVEAHFKTGAGTHGGGKKTRNKRDRLQTKQNLKDEY